MKENFGLYLILTDPVSGYERCAQAAVDCGIRYLQLRMKNTSHARRLDMAQRLCALTRGSSTRLIVNDHLSIAMASDADGVHLGQDDQSITEARAVWDASQKCFGLSTHTLQQVQAATLCSPDYIGIGPVFSTPTKRDTAPALGVEATCALAQSTPLTSVAIGGVDSNTLPSLLAGGIRNFCVVRAVNEAVDPQQAIQQLQGIWKRYGF